MDVSIFPPTALTAARYGSVKAGAQTPALPCLFCISILLFPNPPAYFFILSSSRRFFEPAFWARCYRAMAIFGRHRSSSTPSSSDSTPTVVPELSKAQIKRATRTRKTWALLTSFFLCITVIFLILVEIGGIKNKSVIKDWYFIRIDVSNIIPASVPNFALINTIAQTLGLHDFYQVGLWGFCEGYVNEGVTYCSPPQTLYWFNPVEILSSELLAGASSTFLNLHASWQKK